MTYNDQPINVLWGIFKPTTSKDIPVYKEFLKEDENSTPLQGYIILKTSVSDNTKVFGDGKTLLRVADCQVNLHTYGSNFNSNGKHLNNIKKIKTLLKSNDINFTFMNLGFTDPYSEAVFDFRISYVEEN